MKKTAVQLWKHLWIICTALLFLLLCFGAAGTKTAAAGKSSAGDATRADVAVALWEREGRPASQDIGFLDVPGNASYYGAVQWAVDKGIMDGDNTPYIRPEDPVTREEVCSILYRYAKYKGYDVSGVAADGTENNAFLNCDDLPQMRDDGDYSAAMVWASAPGVDLIQLTDNKINPKGHVSKTDLDKMLFWFNRRTTVTSNTAPATGTTETTATTATAPASASDSDSAIAENALIKMTVTTPVKTIEDQEKGQTCMSLKCQGIQIQSIGYGRLQTALSREYWNDLAGVNAFSAEYLAEAKQRFDDGNGVCYSADSLVQLHRADDVIFSYSRIRYDFAGGANGSTTEDGRNFDSKTGAALNLRDVVSDYDGICRCTIANLKKDKDAGEFFDGYEVAVRDLFYPAANADDNMPKLEWVMDGTGLTVIINETTIAPHALGTIYVQVPYSGNESLFKPAYIPAGK